MPYFEITIKNEKLKYYKFLASLLVLLNMAVFVFLLFAGVRFYEVAAALLLSGLYLIYLFYKARKNRKIFFISEVTFFILAGSWMALQNYPVAFACIIVGILYHLSLQKLQFIVNGDFIKKINFPQKIYMWEKLANVVLKDNILTIDFKNNRLVQLEIENNIDETQFNQFANQQLFKNSDLQ